MEGSAVQLVVTCLVDGLRPEVGKAVVDVLEDSGCRVEVPSGQTCCGQPAFNVGLHEDALRMAAHTIEVLEATQGPIVIPSGSCAQMIVHHYPELMQGTDLEEASSRIAGRTRELTQFLVDDLGVSPRADCEGCVIAYHHSCHGLRGLGLGAQADKLLEGLETIDLDAAEDCCGFGGLFSIEMPAVSVAIMNEKLDRVQASGANTLVGGDLACLIHLEGGLRRRGSDIRVRHIAQLLGEGV